MGIVLNRFDNPLFIGGDAPILPMERETLNRFVISREVHNAAAVALGYTVFVHLLFKLGDDGRPEGEPYRNGLRALELTCLVVIVVVRIFFPQRKE